MNKSISKNKNYEWLVKLHLNEIIKLFFLKKKNHFAKALWDLIKVILESPKKKFKKKGVNCVNYWAWAWQRSQARGQTVEHEKSEDKSRQKEQMPRIPEIPRFQI